MDRPEIDAIFSAAEAAFAANPPTPPDAPAWESDYIGDDDLLYCGECDTPKQTRIVIGDKEITVPCMCKCRAEKAAADEDERKRQAESERIKRLRINGIQDRQLLERRFELSRETELLRRCKRYVDHWGEMRRDNVGLMLWGGVGGGKSHAAACIANALIDKGVPVLITSFPAILAAMKNMQGDSNRYLSSINHYKLLIVDDFGVERNTEYANELLFSVVDMRYKARKPLIITTNLLPEEMQATADTARRRIYDRILEMCVPLRCGGESLRQTAAKEKFANAKEILGGGKQ